MPFALPKLSHCSWFVAGSTCALTPALGYPIPTTPTSSVLETQQEASNLDRVQLTLIANGEGEKEVRGTEAPKLPHYSPDSCWLRDTGEAGQRAALSTQAEEEGSISSQQSCSPILQKVSTKAADLIPEGIGLTVSPLTKEAQTDTNPSPQPPPNPALEGQEPLDQPEEAVIDVENPLIDRVSIPIVTRTAFGIGTFKRTANVTSIQPVLPIPLGKNHLVLRPSIPFIYAPTLNQPQGGDYGLGDLRLQAYFVPKPKGSLVWGVGPTFLFPTAGDRRLGFGKWGIGPALAAVWSGGRWTIGGRIENYWSIAGDGRRANVSQLTALPFLTYTLGKGWYLVSAPVITAFWNIPQGGKWLLPVGGGIGKVMKLGDRPFNISVQAYWHAVRPGSTEGWALVVQFQSLFPRLRSRAVGN